MNKNVFNIMFAVLAGLLALTVTIQCIRVNRLKKDLESYKAKSDGLEIALSNSEAENAKLRELVDRANKALEEGLKQVEEAKRKYDERNEKIDDAPVDWLQCPLPDEVRDAFGAYCYAGGEAADGSTGTM